MEVIPDSCTSDIATTALLSGAVKASLAPALPLCFGITGRRRFVADVHSGIADGPLGKAKIGTRQIREARSHVQIGLRLGFCEKCRGFEQVLVPRWHVKSPMSFYMSVVCNAAFRN